MFFGAVDFQPLNAGFDDGSWLWRTSRPDPALFRLRGPGDTSTVSCHVFQGADMAYLCLNGGLDDGSWLWRTSRPDPALFRLCGPGDTLLTAPYELLMALIWRICA